MRKYSLLMLLVFLVAVSLNAQDDSEIPLQPTGSTSTEQFIDAPFDTRHARLSPDGNRLAWFNVDELCILTFSPASQNCTDVSESIQIARLTWSPDSNVLALEEDVFRLFIEGDLWLYDAENDRLFNRTDDKTDGNLIQSNEDEPPPLVDYLPTWAPNGDLYFFRWEPEADEDNPSIGGIYHIPGNSGGILGLGGGDGELFETTEPELVAQINQEDRIFSIYNAMFDSPDGTASISPDGSQMAVIIRPSVRDDPVAGIWLFDLSTGDAEQIVNLTTGMQEETPLPGLPEWAEPLMFNGLTWYGDQIVFMMSNANAQFAPIGWNAYLLDPATGDYESLLDFTGIEAEADYFTRDAINGLVPPRFSIVLPEDDLFIYGSSDSTVTRISGGDRVWALPLDNPDAEPQAIATLDLELLPSITSATYGRDGDQLRLLINGVIYNFEVQP
jgi:hypothetical protein